MRTARRSPSAAARCAVRSSPSTRPRIDGAQTLGVHRVLQTVINGQPRTGEVYNYSAHFGDYQVIVTANPLVVPDKPVAPVNTQRAGELLVAGVNAIRG